MCLRVVRIGRGKEKKVKKTHFSQKLKKNCPNSEMQNCEIRNSNSSEIIFFLLQVLFVLKHMEKAQDK